MRSSKANIKIKKVDQNIYKGTPEGDGTGCCAIAALIIVVLLTFLLFAIFDGETTEYPLNPTTEVKNAPQEDIAQETTPETQVNCRITLKSTCYLKTGYTMANGEYPEWGYVAVKRSDERFVMGDMIWIEYYNKVFIVGDVLPGEADADIDIFMDDETECVEFGKRDVEVILL